MILKPKALSILVLIVTYLIIGSAFVFLFLGGFFIVYRLKAKNKELNFIKDQKEANETIYQLMLQHQFENQQVRKEEQNRIAMELHDGLMNSIFTTRLYLSALETVDANSKNRILSELEKAGNESRRIAHNLKQDTLNNDKTLPEIIAQLIESQKNSTTTQFSFINDKFIDWARVSTANKINIYRIIQEAIQNCNKYAKATKCSIALLKSDDKIRLRISDNGVGFNPEKAKQGIGLKNISERCLQLHGELKIISNPDIGTTLEVVF